MPDDPLTRANSLLVTGHPAESIGAFDKIISDPKADATHKAGAYLGRSTAAEALAPKDALPMKDPSCRRDALEAHRWLQAHPSVPRISSTARMMFEARVAQGLMLCNDSAEALSVGTQALSVSDNRFVSPDLIQQMKSILAQTYERKGDIQRALAEYRSAVDTAPKGRETPLVQLAIWSLQGGNDRLKPSDWESLIAKFPTNPYIKGVYGNYAQYLLERGDLIKLTALGDDYHRRFDASTPIGSFDTCSVDWNVATGYDHAKRLAVAYQRVTKLKSRCADNPVGALAEQYLTLHKPPSRQSGTFAPIAATILMASVVFLLSYFSRVRRKSQSAIPGEA